MALKVIHFMYLLIILFRNDVFVEAVIGMNWGRTSAQRLVPSQVVDLLLQNGISEARIYTAQRDILQAFANSGIGLTVSILDTTTINSLNAAKKWFQDKLAPCPDSNVRNIYIGNYAFLTKKDDKIALKSVLDSMIFVNDALREFGYGNKTKVTIPQPHSILKWNITRPSEAEFLDEIKEPVDQLLKFLDQNDAPFVLDMFPILLIYEKRYDPSFAYADNKSKTVIKDVNGLVYTNVFNFIYDSFVWALRKAGAPNMKIVVGQVGWPTDGFPGANTENAERFYKSLLPLVSSNKGTPMRPGVPIDTFIHCLTDENRMPYIFPFSRHWGIYRGNGEPKFKIDLSGQGRDIYPTRARGIMQMPQRWCVYNGDNSNLKTLVEQFKIACVNSDCTSLAPGGSCSHLDFAGNISYAFNMYFQFKFQEEKECDFYGFGKVVTSDPSIGSCLFRVDVVRGKQDQYIPTANVVVSSASKLHEVPKCAILLFLLSMFLALI